MTNDQEKKQCAIEIIRRRYAEQREQVASIEPRLEEYFDDLCNHSSATGEHDDRHNLYELLGAIKFLRLLRTYEFNQRKFISVLRLREGQWSRDERGVWHHVSGGLKCPGTTGPTVYRWQPFQVFVLASVFGFYADIDTRLTVKQRDTLLPSEHVDEDGHIIDRRRLCTDFTFYAPRKTDKTGLSAFIQFVFFFFEDDNAEIYCCANSSDQAKLLYRRVRSLLAQMDSGNRIRQTETVCDWRKGLHDSSIRPLSAGGKTKDGMFAQLCCADEFGSAPFTNGKSDMKMLVDVIQSSMGPRREPLTFTTTTAGRVQNGPFMLKLQSLHAMLERELDIEDGGGEALSDDRTLCLCLEPDMWERDPEVLLHDRRIRQKINPMLGRIVQYQFYDDEIAKAVQTGDMDEVVSKLFNVYQSGKQIAWIKPEEVRAIQVGSRIDDCTADKGWVVFVGLDFSQGDDLHTAGYLAARSDGHGGTEFFADCDAWVKQDAMEASSIRPLYEQWVEKGWLHVSSGKVFNPSLFISRLAELLGKGVQFALFGYDSYQSHDPVNALKSYIVEFMGVQNPDLYVMPVSQTYASYNPAVDELSYCVKAPEPLIRFSPSPLWPFCFGNCVLDEDTRMQNKKPVKRNPGSDSCKVDPVQCLCTGFILFDKYEGQMQRI